MGRRSEHSREELRDLIIDAALELLRAQGPSAVTARQIAKAIGYTPGMLYAVFKNQLDIFLHVNVRTLEDLQTSCEASCQNEADPQKRLHVLALAYWSFARQETHQFELLFARHDIEDTDIPTALPIRVQALFTLVETALLELKPNTEQNDIALAARSLWSGVHGATELGLSDLFFLSDNDERAKDSHPDEQAKQVIDALVNQFVSGWLS